jgi:phytoene dehydrogenase-like protein
MGPWSAGSAGNLLLNMVTRGREVVGGPAAIVDALERAAKALGVEIRPRTAVESIRVRAGRAEAVELKGGDEIAAQTVVSSCDPRSTLLDLVGPERLPNRLAQDLRNWRCRGVTASVQLALSAPLTTPDGRQVESIGFGETLDDLERSFDAAKHRSPFNEPPAMQVRQPSIESDELTPGEGRHVATVLVHGVPYDVEGGWSDALKEALGDAVVAGLARHCPGVEDSVEGRQVLTPQDLKRRFRLTGGHLFHGEHAPDQLLFMRPNFACSRHATPLAGLWLCGSGAHPGGGVTGAPGLLAARAILSCLPTAA